MSNEPPSPLGFVNALLLVIALCAAFGTLPFRLKNFPFNPHDIYHTKGFLFLLGVLLVSVVSFFFGKIIRRNPLNQLRGGWGSLLVHLGMGVTLLGGLVTYLFADIRDLTLQEGETISLPGVQTKVRLEKFSLLFYPGTSQPENYVSRLRVEEGRNKVRSYELKVNFPVNISGAKLFQMRYDFKILGVGLWVYRHGKPIGRMKIRPGEKKTLEKLPFLIGVDQVVPDFAIDQEGKVGTRSPYFRNPAALVSLYPKTRPETVQEKRWAFQGLAFHRDKPTPEWDFVLEKVKKQYRSGIKFSRDPGVPIAFSGFVLLVLGAFVSSFVFSKA